MQRRPLTATATPYSALDEPQRSAATCNLETALAQPKQPSGLCLLRLNHDPKNIIDNSVSGIFVEPEKRQRHLYPRRHRGTRQHDVRFMTTNGGRVRFNRKLYSSGLVSLSILGTFHGPSWNPEMTIQTVLVSIQSLVIEHPLANEPAMGRDFGTWLEKTTGYNAKLRFQTLRVMICDALEACLFGNSSYPQRNATMKKMWPCEQKGIMQY
ncbi:hypothetical protein MRX96_040096 [Rhipicephalus microplus]